MICHVGNDRVEGGGLNGFETCPKLIHNFLVPTMESTEKQHHQEDGQYSLLATGQFKSKAIEAGTILDDRGSSTRFVNFQKAPIPFLSDLTCSTHSPYDILKV